MLATSSFSSVSAIENRRRYSTAKYKRTGRSTTSVVSVGENTPRQLTGVEKMETGRVKPVVYARYFQAMGLAFAVVFVLGMAANTVASMARNLWLTDW